MEVLVGPSFSIEVSSCLGDCSGVTPPRPLPSSPRDTDDFEKQKCVSLPFGVFGNAKAPEEEFSDEISSSIGDPDDDTEDDEGDGDGEVVESKLSRGLGSLGSLEDSLPIKRGLSSHFTGKSKSSANLSELSSVKDLEKPENPFNKRRRVLIASKWSRRSSFYTWSNPKSMPLLALAEDDEESASSSEDKEQGEEDEEEVGDGENHDERVITRFHKRGSRLNSFRSRSCFCLSDLQEHEEQ